MIKTLTTITNMLVGVLTMLGLAVVSTLGPVFIIYGLILVGKG